MIAKENKSKNIMIKLRNFCIKDFFKAIHSIPRGVFYSTILIIIHYFQLFSFSFVHLSTFSYNQTEISLLFQRLCIYAKIFPLLELIPFISSEFSFKIWLIFSFFLNVSWIIMIIIQIILSDQKDYKLRKFLMFSTTIFFQLYHWLFFLPFLQISFEFLFLRQGYPLIVAIFNIFFTIFIGFINHRFETSYLFKITDFLERRPSFYLNVIFLIKIIMIFIYTLRLRPDINLWSNLVLSALLIVEFIEKFSFINFIIMQVYSALSFIYAYVIITNILLYYLNEKAVKTFDFAFSICICLPILIKISINLYDNIHQKFILLNLKNITNFTILDQAVRVLYYSLNQCKSNKKALLLIESWIIDHFKFCLDPYCCCQPFLKKNQNFEKSISLKKKLMKLILAKTLEQALKTIKGQKNSYLNFIYLTFLLQIVKIPTKSFAESLKLGEKSRKFGMIDRIFTAIFIEQTSSFLEKKLSENSLKNQKLDFMKLIKFEEKLLKLYEDLIKLILEYIEFYGLMSHSFIDLNQLEAKITHLITNRGVIDTNLNLLMKMNPKSQILQEISLIFYFYLFPINQLDLENNDFLRMREEINQKTTNFSLFNAEASVVSITLLKYHGIIRSHSRNFAKMMKYDTLLGENIARIMPKIFANIHPTILERFTEEGEFSITKDENRVFFAIDKQNFIFPIKLKVKIDVFGLEDFGATGFLYPINKKFCYALASLDGRVLNISQKFYEKSFYRIVSDVSWKQLYKINLGMCLPALLFIFFGCFEENFFEESFDTIFIAPKSPNSKEIKAFTKDFGEDTEKSALSLSKNFDENAEKTFHSTMSKVSKKKKNNKTLILERLNLLKELDAMNLRLFSAKLKVSLYKYKDDEIQFIIVEIQNLSGIHFNKDKIYEKYLQKLISSYEDSEKADIKLFTTTQVSNLGLFADQGFIFRDTAESIRSTLIPDEEKETQRITTTNRTNRYSEGMSIIQTKDLRKTRESANLNQKIEEILEISQKKIKVKNEENNEENPENIEENGENDEKIEEIEEEIEINAGNIPENKDFLEVPKNFLQKTIFELDKKAFECQKSPKEITEQLLGNLKKIISETPLEADNPVSHDIPSSRKQAINVKESLNPYNNDLYFKSPSLLIREDISDDLLCLNDQNKDKSSEKSEESMRDNLKNHEFNKDNDEISKEFAFIEEKQQEITEKPPEKEEKSQEKNESSEEREEIYKMPENLEKKVYKKSKNKVKIAKFLKNQRKLKILESISSNSENSSTKVVKKNFLHLIKNKSLPFSLRFITFFGYLGFIGLALTFSVLFSLLYQNFQNLNENMRNIMFGHRFASPLGFMMKGIEQRVILENFFSNFPVKTRRYNDIQLLKESLRDYESSYIEMINMKIKFEYQAFFMKNQMNLRLFNLDLEPKQISLVFIHAFGLYIEHLRICLSQNGDILLEKGNDAYYFLYQNSIELLNKIVEINFSPAKETNAQLENIVTMIVLFLILSEIVIFSICMIILPIFMQVNRRKEEALVLFCSFQQEVLINKISMYTSMYNEIIAKTNEITNNLSKSLSDVSFINLIKKNRKKISISQHSRLKVNFSKVTILIIASFISISIYPIVNFVLTRNFLNSFKFNIQENIVFGELSSAFPLFYAINYFNINYRFYGSQKELPILNNTISRAWGLNHDILEEILDYSSYDLNQLIDSPYITEEHRKFLMKLKSENLCDLIELSQEKAINCSMIYKGQMKLGLIVLLKAISNDLNEIYDIIQMNPNDHEKVENWLILNNFFDLDMILEFMQPITSLIIEKSITNFQYFLKKQIDLITGLFLFGVSTLVIIGGFGFLKLIFYLNGLLFNARFLLSVLPIDLIQENSYLMSHLSKEFKQIRV